MASLEKLFNDILDSGTFPTHWNIGVIKPIYKRKGDKRSPANYRGITLTSCLGKLFTSILQSRLNKFIEQHNILNPEQFGFRPNSRTTDSLFFLQQLLNKYLPGVLKTGFPEVLSRIQLIAGNLSGHNLLKAVTLLG